jgi:hypothetical protein
MEESTAGRKEREKQNKKRVFRRMEEIDLGKNGM